MALSIHDNLLVSYEVNCEARTILLRTEYREDEETKEFTNVLFTGVQGYQFAHDAFGNIILSLETVPVERFLTEYGADISEYYRMAGAPGPWAENLGTAPSYLREQGIQAFVLTPSLGLFGWVLAREMSIFPVPRQAP